MISLETGVQGFYKLQRVGPDGDVRQDTGWFPNLITDSGMDYLADNSSWLARCYVGSSATPPSVGDTSIISPIADTNTYSSALESKGKQHSVDPYYSYRIKAYEFPVGSATGNIAEVAVGPNTGNVFSRSLVKDGSGNPTTITVLSDEILRVIYEVRLYLPMDDVTGTVDINGTSHAWASRAAGISFAQYWAMQFYGADLEPYTSTSGTYRPIIYSGSIGSVTQMPTGTSQSMTGSHSSDPYLSGSFERSVTYVASPSDGSVTSIGAMRYTASFAAYQIGFTPEIPKSDTERFTIKVKHSWARRP